MKNQLISLLREMGRIIKYSVIKAPKREIDLFVTMPGGLPRKDGDK